MEGRASRNYTKNVVLGMAEDEARAIKFSDGTLDDFIAALEAGADWDEQAVRLATVQTRLDVALLCHATAKAHKTQQRMLKSLQTCAVLLGVLIVVTLFK